MKQTELDVSKRPEIMDDIEYGIKQGVFLLVDGQIQMNPTLSYQDCQNFKANWKIYLKDATKAQKDWDKEQKKQSKNTI